MKLSIINCHSLAHMGAELVFTQDSDGNYRAFFWQPTKIQLDFCNDGGEGAGQKFKPIPLSSYLEKIRRVIARGIPERCYHIFSYENLQFPFELMITPIKNLEGKFDSVFVTGYCLSSSDFSLTSNLALPTNPDPFQVVLTRIARNIRSTLDLETIWQQTVDSIGEALQVSRCLLLAPSTDANFLDVKAEYCHTSHNSLLGQRFAINDYQCLQDVSHHQKPFVYHQNNDHQYQCLSVLIVGTFYQKQLNGVIALNQCDRTRYWSEAESELIQELAEQVGTAIAHATIYQKLEQANIEAEKASQLKSEFLASTSHELRTPLNGILGFLQLVLDDMADDEEEEKEFITQAHRSALHLLNLINDILDIAKIEANKIEFRFDNISLNQICEDVAKFAQSQAEKKNIEFHFDLPTTYDPILIYSDYQRLLQVLLNVVGNAFKFTHEGEISLTVEIIAKAIQYNGKSLPGLVKMSIADTGIGVSLEKQENLFEKFYQVDGSRTKSTGGTGLGLAISRRLIESMGGRISFYSMGESLGSTVTLTIPLSQLPVIRG
ncbi:MAG: GAF domain-containing sensor histidine kinase [Cyanobacterium sp. T60_A2020_053]|nr:GAF domain-containing sensor histidine kinase [Cyanobacterium sp. T60_A2020_053]